EHVERHGDHIKILRRESADNVRQRGEEMRAGDVLLSPGVRLGAGELALLATVGNARPLVSPTLQVAHFTTGDEVVPPDQTPKPGQIRDSNSILIRSALQKFRCDVRHQHLPEDFELAKSAIGNRQSAIENTDLLLVSGGASVGEKDFTRQLLESLGYQVIFNRVMIRPGAPLIFGVNGHRIAFGLPGNPLSHFVCFHLFVAAAIARLTGAPPSRFLRGILASKLDDAPNPRETLWPARWDQNGLTPLRWSSSGDVTSLKATNALVRVPPNRGSLDAGAEVDYLPTE
ncbi:MAG TPA: molybdopterin molybdotransferase MoeA, partial [Verrucomicrobiae bacterium]|nr:molybdopterin molybdotransferase MoeA [Verrucomicrobiae bacterium]